MFSNDKGLQVKHTSLRHTICYHVEEQVDHINQHQCENSLRIGREGESLFNTCSTSPKIQANICLGDFHNLDIEVLPKREDSVQSWVIYTEAKLV